MIRGYRRKMAKIGGRTVEQPWRTWCRRDSAGNRENRQVDKLRGRPRRRSPSTVRATESSGKAWERYEAEPRSNSGERSSIMHAIRRKRGITRNRRPDVESTDRAFNAWAAIVEVRTTLSRAADTRLTGAIQSAPVEMRSSRTWRPESVGEYQKMAEDCEPVVMRLHGAGAYSRRSDAMIRRVHDECKRVGQAHGERAVRI
jgi:hypothetical protein